MRIRLTLVGLGLLLAVAIAAGGPGAGARSAAAAKTVGVTVGDDFFKPKRLSVRTGTRVRWVWRGEAEHNVTVVSGPVRFHSPDQIVGRYTRTLRKPGTYRIVCTIHGFRMRIKVKD